MLDASDKISTFIKKLYCGRKITKRVRKVSVLYFLAMNGFAILSSNLPHLPLLNKKNKIILTLPMIIPLKETLIREIIQFFWISLNEKYPSFGEKNATDIYPFHCAVFMRSRIFAMIMIKTKHQPRINLEREMGVVVSQILPRFEEVCKNKQAHALH